MTVRTLFFAFLLFCTSTAACGVVETTQPSNARNSNQAVAANKDLIDQAAETIFGTEKTGIAECDQAVAFIDEQIKEQGKDSIAARAALELAKQQLLARIRGDVNSRTAKERQELAGYCRQIAAQTRTQTNQNRK